MKDFRTKLIGGGVLLIALCALFYYIQFVGNASVALRESLARQRIDIYEVSRGLELQAKQQTIAEEDIVNNIINTTQLYGKSTKALAELSEIDRSKSYALGPGQAVLRVIDGVFQPSENMPADLVISKENIRADKGWFAAETENNEIYSIFYSKMSDDEYLLLWEKAEESLIYNSFMNERAKTIRAFETALEMHILEFLMLDGEDTSNPEPLYIPEAFSDYHTAEDFGITQEMLLSATEIERDRSISYASTDSELLAGGRSLSVKGVQYECYFRKTNGGQTVTVFMLPSNRPVARAAERTALLTTVFAIVAFSFSAWALSVRFLVIRHSLNDEQKKTFAPNRIDKQAAVFILLGMLAVAGISVFLQCLFANFHVSALAEETLRVMDASGDFDTKDDYQSIQMKNFESSAAAVSLMLFSQEDQLNPAGLDSVCAAIGADYIIIYDETGTQVVSNTTYNGLTLADGGEDMQDFSRLLKGVSPISKACVTDAQTGKTHAVFGASLVRPAAEDREAAYWAMLLFVNPKRIADESESSLQAISKSLDPSTTVCFSVDPESGRILSSSRQDLVGKDAVSLGLPQDALKDRFMGFFWMDGVQVYGVSAEVNGTLYVYLVSQAQVYQNLPQNAIRAVLIYLALMAVLAAYMLFGYKKAFDQYAGEGDVLDDDEALVMTPSGQLKVSIDPSKRWTFSEFTFGRYTPAHNALCVGQTVYMIAVILAAIYAQSGTISMNNSATAYILSGRWTRGLNLFAITSILFLLVGVSVATILCKFLISALTRHMGTKGETIGRLLLDFIRYMSCILFAYYALSYLGMDTRALIASVSILTLAVSLGSQQLVQDILAGLFIVMDGEYQVGDIIEINGFRGTVLAVGVRTTKIEGLGGNILILGNKDVKNVINRTRKNSWYALDINISESEDLGKVEALLSEQLPQIGREIPEIISGPVYKGVENIGRGAYSLSIVAECREKDFRTVQHKLNGAIVRLFEKHSISIK